MLSGTTLAWLAVAGRALTIGASAPLLKKLNEGQSAVVVTTAVTLFGTLFSVLLAGYRIARNPSVLAEIHDWLIYPVAGSVAAAVALVSLNRALRVGDVSLLTPLTALTYVFVYFLDLVVGYRTLDPTAVAGIVVLTAGMALLNLRPGVSLGRSLLSFSVLRQPGAWGAVLFAAATAVARVVDYTGKQLTDEKLLYSVVAYVPVFAICLGIVFLRRQQGQLIQLIRLRGPLAVLVAAIGLTGFLLLLQAFDELNASTAEPVSQLGIVLAVFAGAWYYREPLQLRWLAAVLAVAGAVLVFFAQ